jgi:hypothetical protein
MFHIPMLLIWHRNLFGSVMIIAHDLIRSPDCGSFHELDEQLTSNAAKPIREQLTLRHRRSSLS